MKYAVIGPVAVHLPEKVEDNDFLASQYPKWDMELIFAKTGIRQRHIAAPEECASDLGVAAAEKLFASSRSTATRSIFFSSARKRPITLCRRRLA